MVTKPYIFQMQSNVEWLVYIKITTLFQHTKKKQIPQKLCVGFERKINQVIDSVIIKIMGEKNVNGEVFNGKVATKQ